MSRSKTNVMTIDEMKDRNKKVILSKEQYVEMLERIAVLNEELEKVDDERETSQIEIIHLKNEIKDLTIMCKNYKAEIENKGNVESALKKSMKEMEQNQQLVNEELSKRQQSKYSKKSKEELEKLALERFNAFKNSYKDII
jgi:chromosome segregation ATPase